MLPAAVMSTRTLHSSGFISNFCGVVAETQGDQCSKKAAPFQRFAKSIKPVKRGNLGNVEVTLSGPSGALCRTSAPLMMHCNDAVAAISLRLSTTSSHNDSTRPMPYNSSMPVASPMLENSWVARPALSRLPLISSILLLAEGANLLHKIVLQ